MKMIYELINPQDVPFDLPAGEYTTRVIETGWKDGDFWVLLEYRGEKNCNNNRCLFPLVKHATGWEPTYSDTYVDDITDFHIWDEYKNLVEDDSNSTGIEIGNVQ